MNDWIHRTKAPLLPLLLAAVLTGGAARGQEEGDAQAGEAAADQPHNPPHSSSWPGTPAIDLSTSGSRNRRFASPPAPGS